MSNETEFLNGLIVKGPNENAPEYVKAKISIKREELIATLQAKSGEWINLDVKVAQSGKWYAAVDNWKPNGAGERAASRPQRDERQQPAPVRDDFADDDIPF